MHLAEQDIVKGCIEGNRHLQKQLYESYASKMLVVCARYSRTTAEAEDILQDAFIKIYEKIHTFRFECPLSAWIRRIVVNTAINHLRKEHNLAYSIEIENAPQLAYDAPSAISGLNLADLLGMIRTLPNGCQAVFNMFAIEGYGHQEIADILNISVGTSKSQYARARELLQKKLLSIKNEMA